MSQFQFKLLIREKLCIVLQVLEIFINIFKLKWLKVSYTTRFLQEFTIILSILNWWSKTKPLSNFSQFLRISQTFSLLQLAIKLLNQSLNQQNAPSDSKDARRKNANTPTQSVALISACLYILRPRSHCYRWCEKRQTTARRSFFSDDSDKNARADEHTKGAPAACGL